MASTGDRLAELRGGVTQAEFAKTLDMSQANYWRYESGRARPTDELIIKICTIYDCSAEWLIGLSDERKPMFAQSLTPQEKILVHAFRKCTDRRRNKALEYTLEQSSMSLNEFSEQNTGLQAAQSA